MRATYGQLQTQTQSYTLDESPEALNFIKYQLNVAQRDILAQLRDFQTLKTMCAFTVAGQQYYTLPPDCIAIETIKVGTTKVSPVPVDNTTELKYVLSPVESAQRWEQMNAWTRFTSFYPTYYFERKSDVGVWPIPNTSGNLITIQYAKRQKDMEFDDITNVTSGAVITAQEGDQLIKFDIATLNSSFAGRWLRISGLGDGFFYQIGTVIDAFNCIIDKPYQGSDVTGEPFIIGESPDIPDEGTDLLGFYAAGMYYAGYRNDQDKGQVWMNMYWTGDFKNYDRTYDNKHGGLLGLITNYRKRTQSRVIHRGGVITAWDRMPSASTTYYPYTITP